MLQLARHSPPIFPRTPISTTIRTLAYASSAQRPSGDISSVFPSLSGHSPPPLPPRFASLKTRLINSHEPQIQESWCRLLTALQRKRDEVKSLGSKIVPEIEYRELGDVGKRTAFRDGIRGSGVAVVRGCVSGEEARGWKELVGRYLGGNPQTRGFPSDKPAVYELYWSPSQVLARAHPNILKAQSFLMSHWRSAPTSANKDDAFISTSHPIAYADRLRIRQPGDTGFALGPHIDGGSVERWEEDGYGRGGVYNAIFEGRWEDYDPWEMTRRIPIESNLYDCHGGCAVYRMFQGWLAMSEIGAGEGHLMVCPLLKEATAYLLLRPFFTPIKGVDDPTYLDVNNWALEDPVSSALQGAVPGAGQELSTVLHPHLDLGNTMVHMPKVGPGDYVFWHCDTIHAVDKVHQGKYDSSVMYIPACPLTESNAEYLSKQRETFAEGTSAPDFPSGLGEAQHRGRLTPEYVMKNISLEAQQAMGLAAYDTEQKGIPKGELAMLRKANYVLGFDGF
ncbi:MAG: hypothetical protein Q9220_005213 [cf. Caloplaca sp. 1 TL-2023]